MCEQMENKVVALNLGTWVEEGHWYIHEDNMQNQKGIVPIDTDTESLAKYPNLTSSEFSTSTNLTGSEFIKSSDSGLNWKQE